ncbi:hypothetical protein EDD18DRAFT_1195905, partial [Armillaria luteobubalina]
MAYISTKKSDFDIRLAHLLPHYCHAPPDARIIELLQTNAPPTPIERNSLEATLSETPDRVAELDSLILSTRSLLHYLTKDRNKALENQTNAKRILSPCRRLPTELLTEIFIRCSPLCGPPLDPRALPWTLSQVCRKWRAVAIATHELWSTIYLPFLDDQFLDESRMYEVACMLSVVLDRARPHDLEVIIWLKNDTYTHPVFPVLISSVRYWKSLDITGESVDLGFLSPCRGHFDRLETAVVDGHHRWGSQAIDVFSMAPRLRSFEMSINAPFLLPVNVVELFDYSPFDADTHATLHNLVNIKHLTILCSSYSSGLPRICLPRVSELELRTDRQAVDAPFLTYNQFDLPSLTHLKICTLTNLRCFTIEDCPNINPILGALSIRPGRNIMFPKMSKLDIECGSGDVLDMRVLVELVQSQRDQGALREFKITWQQGLVNDDADIRSRWQQLCVPGGEIQIPALIE